MVDNADMTAFYCRDDQISVSSKLRYLYKTMPYLILSVRFCFILAFCTTPVQPFFLLELKKADTMRTVPAFSRRIECVCRWCDCDLFAWFGIKEGWFYALKG